tara:strand:+ start:76 stop:474 length:399 start_codon:yes stop_codon:yes gene_type:complete
MKRGLLLIFFLVSSTGAFAESFTVYKYSSAESPDKYMYSCGESDCTDLQVQAARIVDKQYGKRLSKRLKDSPLSKYPAYWVYSENECDFRVKAVERMPTVTSTMNWFDVDVCKGEAKKWRWSRNGKNYIDDL